MAAMTDGVLGHTPAHVSRDIARHPRPSGQAIATGLPMGLVFTFL